VKSRMIQAASYIPDADKKLYSDLKVMHSAAGFYIGTVYDCPDLGPCPGSRDSGYYSDRASCEKDLADALANPEEFKWRMEP
jgi:hypothetical protein